MEKKSSVETLFARTTLGIKPGLDIITGLLDALGNPHRKLACIHVAGTNGKGSVCAMLESVLRASGFKTGLYTSPHLVDFSERFRINGEQISDAELESCISKIEGVADNVAEAAGQRPATFFEISTAIAFQYFADQAVDIAIIETGMGGRWDATNVIIPLISVITHIDIDHTNFLGDTIEAIAAEKAGIIKPGRPVVSAPQKESVMAVLQKEGQPVICSTEVVSVDGGCPGARFASSSVGKKKETWGQRLSIETHSRNLPPVNLPLLGECQRENCAVAVAALEVLSDMLDVELEWKTGLESVEWGARFQMLQADPVVILDGAHNPSAARALVKTLRENYAGHQVGFVLGFLGDKDAGGFLREIRPLAAKVWTIPVDGPRGASAEASALQAQAAGVEAEPCPVAEALDAAREWATGEKRIVCIAGSLMIRQMLSWPV